MRPALTHLKVNWTNFDILGWAFSWTSSLSPRPPGGIPASEAAQGEQGEFFFCYGHMTLIFDLSALKLWDRSTGTWYLL